MYIEVLHYIICSKALWVSKDLNYNLRLRFKVFFSQCKFLHIKPMHIYAIVIPQTWVLCLIHTHLPSGLQPLDLRVYIMQSTCMCPCYNSLLYTQESLNQSRFLVKIQSHNHSSLDSLYKRRGSQYNNKEILWFLEIVCTPIRCAISHIMRCTVSSVNISKDSA